MARGKTINLTYAVDVADRGTKHLLAEDRKIRKSVAQTSKAMDREAREAVTSGDKMARSSRVTASRIDRDQDRIRRSWSSTAKRFAVGASLISGAYVAFNQGKQAVTSTQTLTKTVLGLQRATKLDAAEATRWAAQAKVRGIEAKALNMAFGTLSKNLSKATKDAGSQREAFEALGITQKQLAGTGGDLGKLLPVMADSFDRMGPSAQRTASMMALMGRGWQTITPLMASGSKEMREQLRLADKYGVTLGGKPLKTQKDLIATQRELQMAQLGWQVQFSTKIAPKLVQGFGMILKASQSLRGIFRWADDHPKIVKAGFALVGLAVAIRKVPGGTWLAKHMLTGLGGIGRKLIGILGPAGAAGGKAMASNVATVGGGNVVASSKKGGKLGQAFARAGRLLGPLMAAALIVELVPMISKALQDKFPSLSQYSGPKGWGELGRDFLDYLPGEDSESKRARKKRNQGPPGLRGPLGRRGGGVISQTAAMLSPGELGVTPTGHSFMVPGRRAAADNVLAFVPRDTEIFTDHGQGLLASGASRDEALSYQLPHFATGGQVARLAHGVGARGRKLVESVAISKAESGWNESAENRNSDGSTDRGLWQINSVHGRHSTFDPQKNARGMWAVSNKGASWGPWVAYNSGAYRAHMGASRAAVRGMDTTQDVRVPGATKLGFAGRLPSAVGAFQSGFQAGMSGTGLWDADILPDIVAGARAKFTRVGGGSLPGRSRRSGGPAASGPARIQAAIAEANRIDSANYSYSYGAGHSNPAPASGPYDCSAVVARIMQKAGFGFPTGTSGTYMGAGAPGKGKNLSVMSTPGHTYMVLNGRAFGTATSTGGGGWVSGSGYPYRPGFVARHPRDTAKGVFRKGGRVGGFTRTGTSAPSGSLGNLRRLDPTDNAELKTVLGQLAGYLDDVGFITYRRLGRMVGNLAQGIRRLKRGGEDRGQRVQIRRLEAAQRLVQTEQGRRAGLAVAGVERRAARMEVGRTRMGQGLRFLGIDEGSAQGIGATLGLQRGQHRGLKGMQRTLARQLARANKAGDRTAAREIAGRLEEVNETIAESFVSIIEAQREHVRAAAQEQVDKAGFGTTMAQGMLGLFEGNQRLTGTYDTGGAARAEFIQKQILPALQGELAALEAQGLEALGAGNTAGLQDAMLAHIAKQTEIQEAILAATEAGTVVVEEGNEKVAQAVEKVYKDRGGGLTLDYRGEGFPLGLLGVGVGA